MIRRKKQMDAMTLNDRLIEHWNYASKKYNIWFLALYGSQNYGLDTKNSDVDTKGLIIPSFKQLARSESTINSVIVTDRDEHVEIKDCYSMINNFWKQNINFLEILFTEYVILNEDYLEEWQALVDLREEIARFDELKAIKAMVGMAKQKFEHLCTPHESVKRLIEIYGYDGKQLSNIMRLNNFMCNYIKGFSFEECLTKHFPFSKDSLMAAKMQIYNCDTAKKMAELTTISMNNMADDYIKTKTFSKNEKVKKEVEDIIYSVYEKSICKELSISERI